ncbi:LytTR family DNA-binding domain-containing protein [Capnocytophaga sp. oral taxon 878]|uniref:LytR/AlgR family response regulator transcription factor n=1 Tax=Capnocytophaga sp. oral taxon 878 TaxID=1316596 RepID=UPI000D04649C|nr:LytTR family DNA-binding domain-containing protein [Capnocytophaga sp. oral taxon 878]AVM51268.1 DNA-binding response regulator [Capnocytophaga sp. oral taxon 878]
MICIIVDDEPMALQLLESYVLKTPFLQLVGKFSNAIDVLDYFYNRGDAELIYMDIQMPELTGLQLSKKLPPHTRIVFTTAFNQYALDGYKVNAIGYLLKPFNYAEFLETAQKAIQLESLSASKPLQATDDYIFVKVDYKQVKVLFSDILYVESVKDYIRIYLTSTAEPLQTLMSLKKIEELLPPDQFMRVHRSFIVALNKIEIMERNQIIFGKQRITIADGVKEDFLNRMKLPH